MAGMERGVTGMTETEISSQAFNRALLSSERLRIVGLIIALLLLATVVVVRGLWWGTAAEQELLPKALLLLLIFLLYEAVMFALVLRMIHADWEPPAGTWILNLAIETAFPTAGLLLLTASPAMGPYRALVAPGILVYFFFILLSTLRLSRLLCLLTGLFAAVGYGVVTAYTFVRYPSEAQTAAAFGTPVYATYGLLFLFGGLIAAGVAGRMHAHVLAALREAEMRQQRDQMKHDLDIARSIQQGLLPRQSPVLEGHEIAGWSQPAEETGGDYYDWQALPDGKIAVSLADATGHGIGPALVTAVCRAYARASLPSGGELGELLTRINSLLVEDLPPNRFVTFVVGVLDSKTARLQLLSAGQAPILVYRAAQDTVENYDAQGIPFGISGQFSYGGAQEILLSPGDKVVLLTDGFYEWENAAGEQFGLARLKEAIRSAKHLSAQELIAKIYGEVVRFAGGTKQQDDLTALVVERAA
jgi:serine phosphatase RsbU (regulator of sigma subunit)